MNVYIHTKCPDTFKKAIAVFLIPLCLITSSNVLLSLQYIRIERLFSNLHILMILISLQNYQNFSVIISQTYAIKRDE
jgi:hypothetical protein